MLLQNLNPWNLAEASRIGNFYQTLLKVFFFFFFWYIDQVAIITCSNSGEVGVTTLVELGLIMEIKLQYNGFSFDVGVKLFYIDMYLN